MDDTLGWTIFGTTVVLAIGVAVVLNIYKEHETDQIMAKNGICWVQSMGTGQLHTEKCK